MNFACDGEDCVIIKGCERIIIVVLWFWGISAGKCGRDYASDH